MDFKNVPKQYRPIPFWSWNEKLCPEETAEQVRKMDDAGIGGFFMHARGGLQTEYMGEEWFENISAAADAGRECGMSAWAYDENGWPSGFGSGAVNGLGVAYQQKYLRVSREKPERNIICRTGENWFYYDVNPFYVDTLDKKVVQKFIEVAYRPYYEKYRNQIEGFFTDEPQISRLGIPWSFVFPEEYEARYGENIETRLPELFFAVGDYKKTRVKFWKMVTDLFSDSFMKQIYEQCEAWGLKLTGHLVCEETPHSQLTTNGACMPHYEYMHMPGMDWLGRDIRECPTAYQVSSVAQQFGKKFVLSETFALCGHNVSFAELKGIYEWQMVRGINILCQHLEGYSIRGIRKRDYPPAMYYQQPWWSEYRRFVDAMSRESMILAEGETDADVLLLHPQTTAWAMYDEQFGPESPRSAESACAKELEGLNRAFLDEIKALERKHIAFHLGDETLMERHARVEDGKLVLGNGRYSKIITSCCEVLLPSTETLLAQFKQAGGQIVTAEELASDEVTDNPEITYTKRHFDEYDVHFFVNTSAESKRANFRPRGKRLDIWTGELLPFDGSHVFEPWGSLMIVEDNTAAASKTEAETVISLGETLRITEPVQNTLTLDHCDYYFDGVLQEKNGYVLNICERANALGGKVQIHQDYRVAINTVPDTLYLVCETPEKFTVSVNGTAIEKTDCGYFRDKSFRKIDIARYVKQGENTISFDCDFVQSETFYANREKSFLFESEKNKLAYDMEIEAVYLLGTFAVKTDGDWSPLAHDAVRYCGDFVLDAPQTEIRRTHIEQQGYPFFCGELCAETEIDIVGTNPVLHLDRKGINAVRLEIGGMTKVLLTESALPLSDFGVQGRTTIKITLINNLRNLLGPHHLEAGECLCVDPQKFFKEPCVWHQTAKEKDWNEGYCFVETGI